METFSTLPAIGAGNSPITDELSAQRIMTRSLMFSFICTRINGWVIITWLLWGESACVLPSQRTYDMIWYWYWYDMIYDVMWYDMIWYMIWCDVMWCGVVWYGTVRYGMVWYGMVWYGMIYDIVSWYDMMWCDVIWCDVICARHLATTCAKPEMTSLLHSHYLKMELYTFKHLELSFWIYWEFRSGLDVRHICLYALDSKCV